MVGHEGAHEVMDTPEATVDATVATTRRRAHSGGAREPPDPGITCADHDGAESDGTRTGRGRAG